MPGPVAGGGAFQAPPGIPDPRNATEGPGGGPSFDIAALLQSGDISAEEILQMVALLAGIGQGAPAGGPQLGGSPIQQAFAGGGAPPGGGLPPGAAELSL